MRKKKRDIKKQSRYEEANQVKRVSRKEKEIWHLSIGVFFCEQ